MTQSTNQFDVVYIPSDWQKPEYHLGQKIKEGVVVGMKYNRPGTYLEYQYGAGWEYEVSSHPGSPETSIVRAKYVKPPSEVR